MKRNNPAVVQSDGTILVEVDNPAYEAARDSLMRFSDLVKSPEYIHTYRLSPLSLWNAAAVGMTPSEVKESLDRFSRYPTPENLAIYIDDTMGKYGLIRMSRQGEEILLQCTDPMVFAELAHSDKVLPLVHSPDPETLSFMLHPQHRGQLKHVLIKMGYPSEDLAGYVEGDPLDFGLSESSGQGKPFGLRPYQRAACDAFWAGGQAQGGSGVVVLPCGAGKTIVGMGVMDLAQTQTLILTTNVVALRQWMSELLDKTSLSADMVREYSGDVKEIGPVTVTTYQILVYRSRTGDGEFPHFSLFTERNWGLIIYDEVHLLPAPVFRITADLQARRRLGLTATLVREDGREDEVFSLIGPKRFDKPWKELEAQNWIAQAHCHEIRVDQTPEDRLAYAVAGERDKYRIAATNSVKIPLVQEILRLHQGDQVLVIGQYLDQLHELADILGTPILCGQTPNEEREDLYRRFREGELKTLVVSKVANFAVDLPDASVAIQVSGTFGSRQEEAQRLGRILRPKPEGESATFYSLVTRNTKDQDFSQKRQLFLTEQGYRYTIWEAESFLARRREEESP